MAAIGADFSGRLFTGSMVRAGSGESGKFNGISRNYFWMQLSALINGRCVCFGSGALIFLKRG